MAMVGVRATTAALALAAAYSVGAQCAGAVEDPRPRANDVDNQPATFRLYLTMDEHVRSPQPQVVSAIRDGQIRSVTFAGLMAALNDSDVVAYVEGLWKMPPGLEGYLNHEVFAAGGRRYLRIMVDIQLGHDRLIKIIAHELQHALEVAQAADVRSDEDVRKLFERLDSGRCRRRCTETDAALDVQQSVWTELRAHRRMPNPGEREPGAGGDPRRRPEISASAR
jgi:hypothetical protein